MNIEEKFKRFLDLILNCNDISQLIWAYLNIKDILYFMRTCKNAKTRCLQINRLIPQSIAVTKKRNNYIELICIHIPS